MGNCVPSRSDLPGLAESPGVIKRSSLASIVTHDTWTGGDAEDSKDTWCFVNQVSEDSRSASVSLPSSSPLFLLDAEPLDVSAGPNRPTREKTSNRFVPSEDEHLRDFHFEKPLCIPPNSEVSKTNSIPVITSERPVLTNISYDLHNRRHIPTVQFTEMQISHPYHTEGSPGDSGLGGSFATSPRVVPSAAEVRHSDITDQALPGYSRTEIYIPTEIVGSVTISQQVKKIVDRESSFSKVVSPPIPPKCSYQDTFDRHRRRTNTPTLELAGPAKTANADAGAYQRPLMVTQEPMVVFALQPYLKTNDSELSMVENERLLVMDYNPSQPHSDLAADGKRWLVARIDPRFHCVKGMRNIQGLVPARLLAPFKITPNHSAAWFPVDRDEADRMLLRNNNPCGTYLLRPSSGKIVQQVLFRLYRLLNR